MRALVIRSFGGPEVLELLDWPEPEVGPTDVLIQVHAVTVGRTLDVEVRERGADFKVTLPRILGSDPAGIVAATGSEVSTVAVGDRVVSTSSLCCGLCDECRAGRTNACVRHGVVGVHVDGGAAEYCAVPETSVMGVPGHVTFEQAACMGLNYGVAWNLLRYAGRLRAGDDVLVMAAGGGLGNAGVLIAKHLGARVIAAASADWKLERCRELLGADETVNYSWPGWGQKARTLTADGRGAAVVYENVGAPELFPEALAVLRPYGRLVTCGAHGGGTVPLDVRALYRSHLSIIGDVGAPATAVTEVWQAVADRRLEPPPVCHRFPLSQAREAHEAARGRELFGRAVLIVREERKSESPQPGSPTRGRILQSNSLPMSRAQSKKPLDT